MYSSQSREITLNCFSPLRVYDDEGGDNDHDDGRSPELRLDQALEKEGKDASSPAVYGEPMAAS